MFAEQQQSFWPAPDQILDDCGGADRIAEAQVVEPPRLTDLPDLLTVKQYAAWAGRSPNSAYEDCRSGVLREHIVHLGPKAIRIPKKALARLMDGE
jgi:hypothetical protein